MEISIFRMMTLLKDSTKDSIHRQLGTSIWMDMYIYI
jgi:hypothetical protein